MGQRHRQAKPVLLACGQMCGRLEHVEDVAHAGFGKGLGAVEDGLIDAVNRRAVVMQGNVVQPQPVLRVDLFVQGVEQNGLACAAGTGDVDDVAGLERQLAAVPQPTLANAFFPKPEQAYQFRCSRGGRGLEINLGLNVQCVHGCPPL